MNSDLVGKVKIRRLYETRDALMKTKKDGWLFFPEEECEQFKCANEHLVAQKSVADWLNSIGLK